MKKLTANQFRDLYIKYFEEQKHLHVEPKSLIPVNDNSLLWVNSGVATLKNYFSGVEEPPSKRIVNYQKSIRTNDIENVGVTARHHTLFEMFGNFSIGDYFKEEAINFASDFLTSDKWVGISKDKLVITVFEDDKEAYDFWIACGYNKDQIVLGGRKTNFWDMGQGPCGPNTEIFYDRGTKYDPSEKGIELVEKDIENDRYIEIWNVVFSEFNNDGKNNYTKLPRQNIDTGMGFERVVSILQDAPTNFDTDIFQPIIKEIEKYTDCKYDINNYFNNDADQEIINKAFKIISDHLRALVFAISDNAYPSNEKRGYILRKLLRRASTYAQKLNINEPFIYKLVDEQIDLFKEYYKNLEQNKDVIKSVIENEEKQFIKKLKDGINYLNKISSSTISGKDAFLLYDSYGFPLDLTIEFAQENNKDVDIDQFNELLEKQKENSRKNQKFSMGMDKQNKEFLDIAKLESKFVGYKEYNTTAKVISSGYTKDLFSNDSTNTYLITDQTPFYATSGGQVSDKGKVIHNNNVYDVIECIKGPNSNHILIIDTSEVIKVNDSVELSIDETFRAHVSINHSATHLLHESLKIVLGDHVEQQGAYYDEEKLRFDFNHFQKLTNEDIEKINAIVNEKISDNLKVYDKEMTIDEAKEINATATFTEKYGDIVRVVFMEGKEIFSKALCGGTHITNTSQIESFLITSCSSKAANTFRIEAITTNERMNNIIKDLDGKFNELSINIMEFISQNKDNRLITENIKALVELINTIKISLSAKNDSIIQLIKDKELFLSDITQNFSKEKQLITNKINQDKKGNFINEYMDNYISKIIRIAGMQVLIDNLNDIEISDVRSLVDNILKKDEIIILITNTSNGKLAFFGASNCTNIKELCEKLKSKMDISFGGRDDFVQGKISGIIDPEIIKGILNE